MALSERIKHQPSSRTGLPCSVGVLLDQLQGAERDALLVMLGDTEHRGWPAGHIYDALVEEGHVVALQSINRHRGKRCRCGKDAS